MLALSLTTTGIVCFASAWALSRGTLAADPLSPRIVQQIHQRPTSRLGGLALLGGLGTGALILLPVEPLAAILWALTSPIAALGLLEDLLRRLSPALRLWLSLSAASLTTVLLDLPITHLDVSFLDPILEAFPFLGWCIAVLGIAGLSHSFNLIDGNHGLAGGTTLLIAVALMSLSLQLGDAPLFAASALLGIALVGFLIHNWPRGRIFLGDGGAYLLGFWVATLILLLVQRHPQVSPWCALLLVLYPVTETLFSAYRRLRTRRSPFHPDRRHLHSLIYRRLLKPLRRYGVTGDLANAATAPYLWGLTLSALTPALIWWHSTPILSLTCGLWVTAYLALYHLLARPRLPRWLRPTSPNSLRHLGPLGALARASRIS